MERFIANDKLKHHPRNVAEYLETGFSNPISVQFQITNRCPFRCIYCDKVHNDVESIVDDRFIKRLVDLGVKSMVLTGGEPTIYSRFEEDIPKLAEHLQLGLVTTLYKYHYILETHFKWIKVSMDTVDEFTFRQIKQNNGIDKILSNLEKLYLLKKKDVVLGTQIVLTHQNKSKSNLRSFISRVANYCDYVQIRPIESIEPYVYHKDDYLLLHEMQNEWPTKLKISDKFYINKKPTSCPSRWCQLLINTEHEVMLCCNRVTDKIGSLYDEDIIQKSKNYEIDFSKCYHSCVMAINNDYLNKMKNEPHKDFV